MPGEQVRGRSCTLLGGYLSHWDKAIPLYVEHPWFNPSYLWEGAQLALGTAEPNANYFYAPPLLLGPLLNRMSASGKTPGSKATTTSLQEGQFQARGPGKGESYGALRVQLVTPWPEHQLQTKVPSVLWFSISLPAAEPLWVWSNHQMGQIALRPAMGEEAPA